MPKEMLGQGHPRAAGEKSEANEARAAGVEIAGMRLVHQEDYEHSLSTLAWRSKTPVIFRAMGSMVLSKSIHRPIFGQRALAEIEGRWPGCLSGGRAESKRRVKGRPDWCISRQRNLGRAAAGIFMIAAGQAAALIPGSCAIPRN